jgi:hypothetical protein
MNGQLLIPLALAVMAVNSLGQDRYVVARQRILDGTYRFEVATTGEYAGLADHVSRENKALPAAMDALKEKWRAENKIERKKNSRDKRQNKKRELSKPFTFTPPRPQTISSEGPFRSAAAAEQRHAELEAAEQKKRERSERFAAMRTKSMSQRARESHAKAQEQQAAHMEGLQEQIDAILAGEGRKDNVRRLGDNSGGSIDKTPDKLVPGDIKEFRKPDPKLVITHVKGKKK